MNSKYSVVDNNGLSFINLGTMLGYHRGVVQISNQEGIFRYGSFML